MDLSMQQVRFRRVLALVIFFMRLLSTPPSEAFTGTSSRNDSGATSCSFKNQSLIDKSMSLRKSSRGNGADSCKSALGDAGMTSDVVRVALEGWNFCNRVGNQTITGPSPRWADCADLVESTLTGDSSKDYISSWTVVHKVSETDNNLKTGDSFPEQTKEEFHPVDDPDLYAVEKEKYLASLCNVKEPEPWQFWMIMIKNGNFDLQSKLCPSPGSSWDDKKLEDMKAQTTNSSQRVRQLLAEANNFPCFGPRCMNQPVVYHNRSHWEMQELKQSKHAKKESYASLVGSFHGTYDDDITVSDDCYSADKSYFSVKWYKNKRHGSWIFHHVLRVSKTYPWLMLYLRADATSGMSGGYPWETRGVMHMVPTSPDFKVVLSLNVLKGGGPQSQFYLLDIGGCWKNSGAPCDGDLSSDVTRYSEMIINPEIQAWCKPDRLDLCPPYHTTVEGVRIYRNDTHNFPYDAYHLYCSPFNAKFPVRPFRVCDRYSNPMAQELLQLLPHSEWGVHGYPAMKGDGWVGDQRTWDLDAGSLSSRLYFYQDPDTPPATRRWTSIDVGTEIYISNSVETAEWTLSDFNVLITQ